MVLFYGWNISTILPKIANGVGALIGVGVFIE